jgi:hypothetical protein
VGLFDAFKNTNGGNNGTTNEPANVPPVPSSDNSVTPPMVSQDITSSITPSNDYVAPVAGQATPVASYTPPTGLVADDSTTPSQSTNDSDLNPGTTTADDSSATAAMPYSPVASPDTSTGDLTVPAVDSSLGTSQSTESTSPTVDTTQPDPVAPTTMDSSFTNQPAPDAQPPAVPPVINPEANEPGVVTATESNQVTEADQTQTMEPTGGPDYQFPPTPNIPTTTV